MLTTVLIGFDSEWKLWFLQDYLNQLMPFTTVLTMISACLIKFHYCTRTVLTSAVGWLLVSLSCLASSVDLFVLTVRQILSASSGQANPFSSRRLFAVPTPLTVMHLA